MRKVSTVKFIIWMLVCYIDHFINQVSNTALKYNIIKCTLTVILGSDKNSL